MLAGLCRAYRIGYVTGDRYAGELAREPWRAQGIGYRVSERVRSDLYLALLPLLNLRRVELPEHANLQKELLGLERRTARSGRDRVDHGRSGRDDVANAVAGGA